MAFTYLSSIFQVNTRFVEFISEEYMQKIEIIEQNKDFLIINKSAGLSFHNEAAETGLFNQLKKTYNNQLWPVHRLDKMTSGILLFATNKNSASLFGKLFQSQKIQKTYLAISDKKPKKKQGVIIGDMQKSRNGSWKLLREKHNPAKTKFFSRSLTPGKRLFWVVPQTGKTHQIRVALKSLSAPIIGDQRYSGTPADRGYLHAYQLNFEWEGQSLAFSCLPSQGEYFLLPDFLESLSTLKTQARIPTPLDNK